MLPACKGSGIALISMKTKFIQIQGAKTPKGLVRMTGFDQNNGRLPYPRNGGVIKYYKRAPVVS